MIGCPQGSYCVFHLPESVWISLYLASRQTGVGPLGGRARDRGIRAAGTYPWSLVCRSFPLQDLKTSTVRVQASDLNCGKLGSRAQEVLTSLGSREPCPETLVSCLEAGAPVIWPPADFDSSTTFGVQAFPPRVIVFRVQTMAMSLGPV